jgi:hypothetical protein
MKNRYEKLSGVCLALGAIVALTSPGFAANMHVIVATQDFPPAWTYAGQSSAKGRPLVVGDLARGDTVEISIPSGDIPHGFITTANGAETKDLVWACGQSIKPNTAVLRETNCGAASQFGVRFTGQMELEVLDTFKDDVNFWCVVHKSFMPGILRLKH